MIAVALVAIACTRARSETGGDSSSPVQVAGDSSAAASQESASASDSARTSAPNKAPPPAAATATPAPSATATPSETVLTGKIVSAGVAPDPRTVLQVEGGGATTLTGPPESELRRLGGAVVWVAGSPVSSTPRATFAVTRYEIVSIDGVKPLVGQLALRDGATWLAADRDTVKLVSAPAELTAKVGAKVWVVGRRSANELTPQTYGVIREP